MGDDNPVSAAAANSGALEVLLDIELPVSVSFGCAEVTLSDALKLTIGSNIELDRSAGDPVDMLVNNRLIARGEVVMVDGHYGVRIQQIINWNDRVQPLALAANP